MQFMKNRKFIIAVTGASGAIYAKLLLRKLDSLRSQFDDCAVIFSGNGRAVWSHELGEIKDEDIPFRIYEPDDLFAPPASGSAGFSTMIICPCSMGTMGRIANGVSNDLITRAADVILKERRRLLLVTREMPLSLIHTNNMNLLTSAGAIICPASPSFYCKPGSIDEVLMTVVDKVLGLAGLEFEGFQWGK